MVPKVYLKNPPACPILHNWVFDNFILADEPFAKALQSLEKPSVNNNLFGTLVSSLESPIAFDGRFRITSVAFSYSWFYWVVHYKTLHSKC